MERSDEHEALLNRLEEFDGCLIRTTNSCIETYDSSKLEEVGEIIDRIFEIISIEDGKK